MAITEGSTVTLDESDGLQNATATPNPPVSNAEDANDNDFSVIKTTYVGLPADFVTALSGTGTLLDAAVSGHTGAVGNFGSNAFTFDGTGVTGLAFADDEGNPLIGDVDTNLTTVSGKDIRLYTSPDNDNVLFGMVDGAPGEAGATVAFAAYLEETGTTDITGAKIWMVQHQPIFSPTSGAVHDEAVDLTGLVWVAIARKEHFDFLNAPSGQNLFLMASNGTSGVVVTGRDPADQSTGASITTGDTVNTSKGGGATTIGNSNQMVDPGEGIDLTFVTEPVDDFTIPLLDQGEADVESNIQFTALKDDVFGASFDIVQLQKGKTASVKVTAQDTSAAPGVGFIGGPADVTIPITSVVVLLNGDPVTDVTIAEVPAGSGVWVISGIKAGYTIECETEDPFNRLLIENSPVDNHKASFDIGGISLLGSVSSTDQIGQLMRFEDAGPAIAQGTPDDSADVNTQDAATIGAATDTDTQSFAAAFTISSSKYDTDGAGTTAWTYAFSLPTPGADSQLNSHGANIYLYLVAGKVIGSTSASALTIDATNTIFDLAVDAAGVVTMKQYFQVDHATPGVGTNFAAQQEILANGLIMLNATATITDGDLDTASSAKSIDLGGNVKFDDDGPGTFTPDSATLVNTGSATVTDKLLNSDGTEGADIFGTVKFVDDDPTDALLRDTNGNVLQSGEEDITLSGFGTTTLTAKQVTSGATVFVATINNTDDEYTITYSLPIDDGSGVVDFLGAAPVRSGNPTYNILQDVGDTGIDILFSGGDTAGGMPSAHTVNVSTTGAGTDNQSMNFNSKTGVGDMLRMDFGTQTTLTGSPTGSEFDFDPGVHSTINGFSFLLSQNTPSGTTGTMFLQCYDADNDEVLQGDGDDDLDAITKVSVNGITVYENGAPTNAVVPGMTVTATLYDGGIVLTGLSEGQTGDGTGGDDPVIKVSTADGFNRIEVSNYSGQTLTTGGTALTGGDFDIAPAGFEIPQAGDPFSFNLPVRNYDFDEDFSPIALIGVNMTPEPLP